MNYPQPLIDATLVRRWKRFLCEVRLADDTVVTAWCPNPGSMKTCFEAGAPCRISASDDPKRKLRWTLEQVRMGEAWVMVHPSRANDVVAHALEAGRVPELAGAGAIHRERRYGSSSRIDFLLEGEGRTWVEVKHVTLAADGVAAFPDAVTTRGQKHLRDLMEIVADGHRAVLLFHVGRSDAETVRPAEEIDPTYAEILREAVAAGVEVLPYRCEVEAERLVLGDRLPLVL